MVIHLPDLFCLLGLSWGHFVTLAGFLLTQLIISLRLDFIVLYIVKSSTVMEEAF